jgi:HlyD family secretion protein
MERAVANAKMAADRLQLLHEGFRKGQTEQARVDVERARTVLKQSESVAREAEIRAPADGVILHRMAEPGLLLGAGQPAVTMAFADRLYVRTFIPETQLGRVRPGSLAEVTVDALPGKVFPAKVTEISPDAEFTPKPVDTPRERVNLVYAAKVDLDAGWNAPLVPGQPADVRVKAVEIAPK